MRSSELSRLERGLFRRAPRGKFPRPPMRRAWCRRNKQRGRGECIDGRPQMESRVGGNGRVLLVMEYGATWFLLMSRGARVSWDCETFAERSNLLINWSLTVYWIEHSILFFDFIIYIHMLSFDGTSLFFSWKKLAFTACNTVFHWFP